MDLTELTAIAFVPHRIGLDLRPEQATYRLFTDAEAWARFVLDNLRTRADAAVGRVAPPVKSADDAKAATPIAPLPLGIDPDVVEQLGEGVDFDSQALIFVSPGAMPAGSGIRIEQVYWEDARPEQAGRVYVQVAFTSLSIRSKFLRTVYPNDVVIFNTSELGQQIPEMVPEVIFVDTDGKVLENQLWLELAPSVDDTK